MLKIKFIENTQGKYSIREDGVLFRNYKNGREPRVINGHVNSAGYKYVSVSYDYGSFIRLLHRLVAEAFIPNEDISATVDHIDENKGNNRVDNLRWCSAKENVMFYHKNNAVNGRVLVVKNILKKAKRVREDSIELRSEIKESIKYLQKIERSIVNDLAKLDKESISSRSYLGYKDITGDSYSNVEDMVKAVGKEVKVNGKLFISAGAAASFILEESGRSTKRDISKRIRKFLSNPKQLVCTIYGKYVIT